LVSQRKAALLFVLLAVLVLTAHSHAQQSQPQVRQETPQPSATPPPVKPDDDVVRINTNLVQVDAVVTDKDGRQVTDLKADDFEIVEDGRPRVPEYFSYVSLGSVRQAGTENSQPGAHDLRRTFVFVVSNPIIDVGFSLAGAHGGPPRSGTFSTQQRAVRAADNTRSLLTWFVYTQMTSADLVAIADTDVDIGVLASYTNDRDLLHAAIGRVRDNAVSGASPVVHVMLVNGDLALLELMQRNLDTMQTLEGVVSQVASLPGRKVVTLVARGLLYNPSLPYWQTIRDRMQRLIERANRAHIVIYTLQTRDLDADHLHGRNRVSDGLMELAKETGGRAIYNTNDLRVGFAEVVEENRGYYLLAYNPGAEAQGRPHRLQVRVKRKDVKVLTRSEAFAGGTASSSVESTAGALLLPLAVKDLSLSVSPLLISTGPVPEILTSLKLDLTSVESRPKADGTQAFSLMLSVRVAGPDGRPLKQADRDVAFEVKDTELEATRREGLASQFQIEAQTPGFYRISVAVRDNNSGRIGSATRFFEIRKRAR
jgi:VWFA-related protein